MKLTATFLGLTAARNLAMGSQSGNLLDPSEQSMGAGITEHDDNMFNQLSKAPTPQPSGDSNMHDALHDDTHGWTITTGTDCHIVKTMEPNGRWCVQDDLAKTSKDDEKYGIEEFCKFTFTGKDKISVENFKIEGDWSSTTKECPYDWLKVGDKKYCGPANNGQGTFLKKGTILDVSGTTKFEFRSDYMINNSGFKLCSTQGVGEYGNTAQIKEQKPLKSMPTSRPTSFPTKIRADAQAIGDTHDVTWGWKIQSRAKCLNWDYDIYGDLGYCTSWEDAATDDACQASITDDKMQTCITDGVGKYENDERCKFTFTGPGILNVNQFFTERDYDFVSINNRPYSGRSSYRFNGMALSGTTNFEFTSDYMVTRQGFKFCVDKPQSKGSICKSKVAWADGSTTRPVGWVGAGPGDQYCNVWKCEVGQKKFTEQDFTGTFRKQKKICSVEEHGTNFCSHTSCTFEGNPKVIKVHSDHREEVGGWHKCGFNQHAAAQATRSRPACDCVCHGARRQDKQGFARSLNDISARFNNEVKKSNLPPQVTMQFKMNKRGKFEGSIVDIIIGYDESIYQGWSNTMGGDYWLDWWKPEGTCAIEQYKDTTNPGKYGEYTDENWNLIQVWHNSLGLKHGNNMAWHVQNTDGLKSRRCQMRTKNLFTPPRPDMYHMCQFTAEITDLDETEQKEGLKKNKEMGQDTDQICFSVMDENDKVLTKKCQTDDIGNSLKMVQKKTLKTKYIDIPLGGVRVEFDAITTSSDEHWFADNLRVVCKKVNRVVNDNMDPTRSKRGFDRKFNTNNFYSQHNNIDRSDLQSNLANANGNAEGRFAVDSTMATQYSEKDHTYRGQRVAHFHHDN